MYGGYLVDTVASFTCNFGYIQNGANSRTCQASGIWNEDTPICEGFYYPLCVSNFTWSQSGHFPFIMDIILFVERPSS